MRTSGGNPWRAFGVSIVGMAVYGICAAPVQAAIRRVPQDYSTIQAAVDASQSGDTVLISPGTYGAVNTSQKLNLTIAGTGDPSQTVMDSIQSINPPAAAKLQISNVTIRAVGVPTVGLYLSGRNGGTTVGVTNCVIQGYTFGISLGSSVTLYVTHSVIRNNINFGIEMREGFNVVGLSRSALVSNGVAGLSGTQGVGVSNGQQTVSLMNSVVALNGRSGTDRGGIYLDNTLVPGGALISTVTAENTMFYGNKPEHVHVASGKSTFTDKGGTIYLDPANGQPKVICTELYRQGFIPDAWFIADSAYANLYIDSQTRAAYVSWARPLVKLMQHSRFVTALVRPFGVAWAQHMAYVMGASANDSVLGRWLNTVGVPLNRTLGKCLLWHQPSQSL